MDTVCFLQIKKKEVICFINHSRKPNLILRRYPIAIIVKRDISPGDELTIDYRKEPLNSQYINDRPFL